MEAGGKFCQLHEILAVVANVYAVRIDGALTSSNRPLQSARVHRRGYGKAVTDARLYLGAFLVVIPRDKLKVGQRLRGIIEAVDFRKCLQPGLAALL
jgi:hypothetical protein